MDGAQRRLGLLVHAQIRTSRPLQSASGVCEPRGITEDWPARAKITGAAYIIEDIVNGAKTIVLDLSRVLRLNDAVSR